VTAKSYEIFDDTALYRVIERLKNTVELMTSANEIRKDYQKICNLMFSLLFANPIEIKTDSMKESYISIQHKYMSVLMNPPTQLSYEREQEAFEGEFFHIQDTIYNNYDFKIADFNDIK
jgi:hypothetical protein